MGAEEDGRGSDKAVGGGGGPRRVEEADGGGNLCGDPDPVVPRKSGSFFSPTGRDEESVA